MVDSNTPPATTDEVVRSASASPKEDPATKSAREELKHTVISEKQQEEKTSETETGKEEKSRPATPETKDGVPSAAAPLMHLPQDVSADKVSSPKKKRAHAEVDNDDHADAGGGSKKNKDEDKSTPATSASNKLQAATATTSNGTTAASPSGAEPDKKRLRDQTNEKEKALPASSFSSSAFASSGFAKLASSASPFGSLGGAAAGTPSLFGSSSKPTTSVVAATPGTTTTTTTTTSTPSVAGPPKLTFGGTSAASPFASLPAPNNKVFGSGFGSSTTATTTASTGSGFGSIGGTSGFGGFGGFGGSTGGLTSFAKPGETFKSAKPARPFGAPESSEDESDGGDDAGGGSGAEEGENGDGDDGDEAKEAEDASKEKKKKQKLQKVVVDDGETGEATLLQVRARLYYMDKDLGGWKERGAGMLKINVPEQCVEYDRDGAVIPASFDASTLEDDGRHNNHNGDDEDDKADKAEEGRASPKAATGTGLAAPPRRTVVRLIMRQDSTLRVILNTIVLAATEFKDRQTLKSTAILFTAFEGPEAKPVNVQVKMNTNNAKVFLSTMEGIQRELRGV